jgi:hypothetical protein
MGWISIVSANGRSHLIAFIVIHLGKQKAQPGKEVNPGQAVGSIELYFHFNSIIAII